MTTRALVDIGYSRDFAPSKGVFGADIPSDSIIYPYVASATDVFRFDINPNDDNVTISELGVVSAYTDPFTWDLYVNEDFVGSQVYPPIAASGKHRRRGSVGSVSVSHGSLSNNRPMS